MKLFILNAQTHNHVFMISCMRHALCSAMGVSTVLLHSFAYTEMTSQSQWLQPLQISGIFVCVDNCKKGRPVYHVTSHYLKV